MTCVDEVRAFRSASATASVCGPSALARPCAVVSLGSNYDDSYERGMHDAAGCHAYISI